MASRAVRLRLLLSPPERQDIPESAYEIERIPRNFGRPRAHAAAVVDVLRATTTLAHATGAGAAEVVFFADPDAARRARRVAPAGSLLCGEREGLRIEGFDLGNSPLEYTAERVRGATLLFCSTNGSRAFLATHDAAVQWAVAFVNLGAAAERATTWLTRRAEETPEEEGAADLWIVCAGKLGEPSDEDTACAARYALLIMARLSRAGVDVETQVEGGALAHAPESEEETLRLVTASEHGRYLAGLGEEFAADVEVAARWDVCVAVPEGKAARLF